MWVIKISFMLYIMLVAWYQRLDKLDACVVINCETGT